MWGNELVRDVIERITRCYERIRGMTERVAVGIERVAPTIERELSHNERLHELMSARAIALPMLHVNERIIGMIDRINR